MAVTVLALAAAMIRNQVYGSSPVTTRYTTFTGGFGMIVSGIGILSVFASVPALVPIALDGLAGILFLGGGIVRFLLLLYFPFHEANECLLIRPPGLGDWPQER